MTYKLIIFDFDGTLADSFPFFVESMAVLARAHGFRLPEREELESMRGQDARQVLAHVGLPLWKVPRVAAHYRRLAAHHADRVALFGGATAMLQQLVAQGIALALVSSNSEQNARHALGPRHASLIRYFECGAAIFGKRGKLRKVLAASGVPPTQVLCIGDELRDLEAARAEGLDFGAVSWGYTRFEALLARRPERAFEKFADIAQSLAQDGGERGGVRAPPAFTAAAATSVRRA